MNPYSYPTVFEALRIIAVLPSTSCSCERSILSLRCLKDYTQSRMKSDRLNGLSSMYIHRDMHINPLFVLKKFILANPNRRTNFGNVDWFRKIWNISLIFILLFLVFWIDVAVYFAALCSSFTFLLFRKGRFLKQQYVFISRALTIQ